MSARRWEATALVVLAVVTGLAVWFAVGGPAQALVVAVFLLVAPGAAVLRRSVTWPPLVRATAVVATSVSLDVLLATALMYLGWWSAELVIACLVVLCVGALLPEVVGRRGRHA